MKKYWFKNTFYWRPRARVSLFRFACGELFRGNYKFFWYAFKKGFI